MITQKDYAKHAGLTAGRVSQLVKKGMPLDSVETADRWRGSISSVGSVAIRREAISTPGPRVPRSAEAPPIDAAAVDQDGPVGAYERQRAIERHAYTLAMDAMSGGSLEAPRLVQVHAQAAKNLAESRQQVLALQEHERQLIPFDWVKRFVLDHDAVMVQLVKAMPATLATRILPTDPQHAERELTLWVEGTLLKTMFETRKEIDA